MSGVRALDPRAWPQAAQQALERWQQERPWRERAFLLLAAVGLLLAAADHLLNLPLERRLRQAGAQAQARQAELDALQQAGGPKSDAQALRAQAQALQHRLDAAQQALAALQGRARDATRLPETLQAITGTVGSVRLLGLDLGGDPAAAGAAASPSGAPGPVPAGPAAAAAPGTAATPSAATTAGTAALAPAGVSTRLYRLPITLKVGGSYAELQVLLARIEEQAPALNWTRLKLDAAAWPGISMTLQAHVTSTQPRWGAAP